ncbi:zinc finger MYM-type protein 2 isoform X1 [Gymnodraco acuticeps]|uniref:Zinc finger MYM-type protein 2 isoform X1 n=1 Tax=Gymnodraco acuticeps TaxID=8218 RepID=A0A6P8TI28_GYMAC|nr:zinc finger MYM-type protein 2 isoform X1 [Gymnodraco acuticeps]
MMKPQKRRGSQRKMMKPQWRRGSQRKMMKPQWRRGSQRKMMKPQRRRGSQRKMMKPQRRRGSQRKMMKPQRRRGSQRKMMKPQRRRGVTEEIDETSKEEGVTEEIDEATKEEGVTEEIDETLKEEGVTEELDDASKEEGVTEELDDASKEEGVTEELDDASNDEGGFTEKDDEATKKEGVTEELDDASKEEGVTEELDDASNEEGVTEKDDEATKKEGVTADNDDDDDVVLLGVEDPQPSATTPSSHDTPSTACLEPGEAPGDMVTTIEEEEEMEVEDEEEETTPASPASSSASTAAAAPPKTPSTEAEPIVIEDEDEEEEEEDAEQKDASSSSPGALSSTEPDSKIRISSVTTLGSGGEKGGSAGPKEKTPTQEAEEDQEDMNLMITSVTSLQDGAATVAGEGQLEENGLQISSSFSLTPETPSGRPTASFNPGRGQLVQNGDSGTHNRADLWISQSASVPRNQKQSGVDSPSPASSLPKPPGQSSSNTSSSGSQPQARTVKVTCANCKKPLKKGQTAYQRKGSTHLFCSTTCLSAFSHKPAPKKSCTMCKKDITNMKGTIVAQVDSSEAFQEFCSTGCLGAYENKQNPPKSILKTKCTVCGKLTEFSLLHFSPSPKIRHEVSFKTVTHKICSDTCFNVYRRANGLIMNCCEQCGDYLPCRSTANHFLLVDGQQKRFCCQNCIRDFKQANSKLASCLTCKTLIKTGEVLHSLGASGTMGSYCSVNCMNKSKMASTSFIASEPTCHFCKRNSLPQYQATLSEGNILNFCSSQCVTKFQNTTLQTATNGQTALSTRNNGVQLKCNYCRGVFSLRPEVLEWEEKAYQFCSKTCCEDYKKLHCIVTFCEYCQEEKTLHEMVKFSGVKRPFCSEGCKLLFKQDFIKRLGLKCVSCNHCSQLCKRGLTRQLGGMTRDFCSEACAKKFHDWYHKAARCDCCKVQGSLTESVMWREEMKQFCDQDCLLKFYLQQNDPIMVTQKGPENCTVAQGVKLGMVNQGTLAYAGGGLMRDVKNKAVLCKPLTLTKATYCKPHMQSKLLQTDVDDGVKREYIPVPIPVPVFIPVPMNMYSQFTPTPFTLPVPVPVPVFLPTTLQGAEQLIQTFRYLKREAPSDPPEADKLSEAEVISDDEKPDVKRERREKKASSSSSEEEEEKDEKKDEDMEEEKAEEKEEEDEEEEEKKEEDEKKEQEKEEEMEDKEEGKDEEEQKDEEEYEPDLDLEADFPQASEHVPVLEGMDEDLGFSLPPVLAEEKEEPAPRPQPRTQGNKKQAVEEGSDCASSSSPADRLSGRSLPLKARYGVNAWKRWAMSPDQSDDTKVKDSSKPGRSKSNLLSLSSEELNAALSRFVREVCRPGGERYSADSIFYLCLGIQQHLHSKGRTDDLFSDPCYLLFGEELNKVLKDWQPSVLPDGSLWGRVQEQSLWSSRQLGQQSPDALLRSLVYLNTKHLGLRTVEQHLRLSFANVYGPDTVHPVTKETSVCARVPSLSQDHSVQTTGKRKRSSEDGDQDFEADEDSGGSSARCPVKKNETRLYDLYRSKCPSLLRERLDVFYVQPDPSCGPDDPLRFSSTPLERQILESLLTRVLLVRDVYTDTPHLEEEGGGEAAAGAERE